MLGSSAIFVLVLGLPFRPGLVVALGLLLGFTAQAVKISVDTIVQHYIVDAFRGRVFALYDMLFNIALVVAAVLTAAVLPQDGHSPAAVVVVAVGWAATAVGYVMSSRRTRTSVH
jgi:ABC-type iron transport system FetAB permease component